MTVDGQNKLMGAVKSLVGAARIRQVVVIKRGEQKKVLVKKGDYKSWIGGGQLMPWGGTLPCFATARRYSRE